MQRIAVFPEAKSAHKELHGGKFFMPPRVVKSFSAKWHFLFKGQYKPLKTAEL